MDERNNKIISPTFLFCNLQTGTASGIFSSRPSEAVLRKAVK